MPANEFLVLWLSSWAAIAFFRIAPAFALRGRTLSPRITEALGYIPPAAFAALVANDLVNPGAFDAGLWPPWFPGLRPPASWRWQSRQSRCCGAAFRASCSISF
ncbi:MAG: AzlD domain-containing protein [Collinsella sp.]